MSPERSLSQGTSSAHTVPEGSGRVETQQRQLKELVNVLAQPEIQHLIRADRLTFGLVRPQLHDPTGLKRPREGLLKEIRSRVRAPLRVAKSVPLQLDEQAVEELWTGHSRDSMLRKRSLFTNDLTVTRWNDFLNFMLSGESEILLLSSDQPGAVRAWREHIGDTWDVSKMRQKVQDDLVAMPRFTSFRALYAPANPQEAILNNAFHGSSNSAEVARELEVIRLCAQRALTEQVRTS